MLNQVEIREIVETVTITNDIWILLGYITMKILLGGWRRRLLIMGEISKTKSETVQTQFKVNFCRFLVVEEPWIHHYLPGMKESSKYWTFANKRAPKKVKLVPSSGKSHHKGFLEFSRHNLCWLFAKKTFIGQCYTNLLNKFIAELIENGCVWSR